MSGGPSESRPAQTSPAATRPAAIRIDDLADPQFPPHIAEMMRAIEPMAAELRFDTDAVLDQASADTRLDDFGDDNFREPLGVLLLALDTQAERSAMGRVSAHAQVSQLARNRLLVEDVLRAHPEILDVEIERPIFIVGQPRTGTTHLHNLIAWRDRLR